MKITQILAVAFAGGLVAGCTTMPSAVTPLTTSEEYSARESMSVSLFPSDQAVLGDEAVARILSSKLELPPKAKLALMRFPQARGSRHYGTYYGAYYWRDEEYLKLQEDQVHTLSKALLESGHIVAVTPLPSLMTPNRISIPLLREAAVRMQADLLLVFRIESDTYSQYRAFAKDKVKAYSTCELVLLDVRTGLVPFTRVVSRDRLESKQSTDLHLPETMRRAEQGSAAEALKAAADDLVGFVNSTPRAGG